MFPPASPLLTDLYQLNMVEAYLADGETKPAVFEFLVRRLPDRRGFLVAAGLEQALEYLETLRYPSDELLWLETTKRFSKRLLDYLATFRFTGEVQLARRSPHPDRKDDEARLECRPGRR